MVPIQHIRGIGAVLADLAGALVLFGATPAFGSQTPRGRRPACLEASPRRWPWSIPSSPRCAWLADQSDHRRGGGARSGPERQSTCCRISADGTY